MNVIKSSKKSDNADIETKYNLYLSHHEFVSLVAALDAIAVPNLDKVEEERRREFFDRFNAPTQKTLLFLATDLISLL